LTDLVQDSVRHARFLHMLSMLEHMGSRKIMLSQMHKAPSEHTLKHLAEEARHAYFFKRQAERIAKMPLDGWTDENTMARLPALMYFGRMDAGISKVVGEDKAYQWVSLIIELRACWVYEMYQAVLEASPVHLSLKSLLAEEDLHLAQMFAACGDDTAQLQALSLYETNLFAKLWSALEVENDMKQAA